MLVVAFPPGGPSDVLARIVGKKMEQLLGQPVIIENKPGAGGNIAADFVARATPDGYTLLVGNNSILATNEFLYKKLSLQPGEGFRPHYVDRDSGQYPGGQSESAGSFAGGADRSVQGAARQDQFCFVRLWRGRASCR